STDERPSSDTVARPRLTDVLPLPDGTYMAIATDGTLYRRTDANEVWSSHPVSPSALIVEPGTWRLATTGLGWFAWRYEGGLCFSANRVEPWGELRLPEGIKAVGGICGDPTGAAVVWVAAVDGALFRLSEEVPEWDWQQLGEPWRTGGCAYLDALTDPPSV